MKPNIRALQKIGLLCACTAMLCILQTRAAAMPLYTELTRLHVIANSDTAEDQALKLCVRDSVLEVVKPMTEGVSDAASVRKILDASRDKIQDAARLVVSENGYSYPIKVSLESDYAFDRRDYDGFSLPAGKYTALRVEIGDAAGQNWWCVLFPPLCTAASMEELEAAASASELGKPAFRLMTDTGTAVEVRFWILDFLAKWF